MAATFELMPQPQRPDRAAITRLYRCDETAWITELAQHAALTSDQRRQTEEIARRLAEAVREARAHASGVDALMHEFSLSSSEGVALMCLAEALLRIPDAATRDRLIRDKIAKGNWRAHLGTSPSIFVNFAAWGLLITREIVASHSDRSLTAALNGALRRGGEPLVRKGVDLAMRLVGRQFVTGETIAEALAHAGERESRGYRHSYDMLGEAALTAADVERYFQAYADAIQAIGRAAQGRGIYKGPGISVKLSALHPRYARAQRARVMAELLPRVKSLLQLARSYDIGFNIDAEEADRLDLSLDLLEALATDPAFAGWQGIGFVVQAYQKRAPAVIDWIVELGRRTGHRLMVRLVKGAYWDAEIKRAQVDGLADYPVYTRKVHTDVAYLACAKTMLAAPEAIYPQFATHNAHTIAAIHVLGPACDYEFQCLHGMGEAVYDEVVGAAKLGHACRIYAPVGSHETLLAYLVRRLLENGANTSFVNRIVDPAVSLDELIADPVAAVRRSHGARHPHIPLPGDLHRDRRNARGVDLSDETVLGDLARIVRAQPAAIPQTAAGRRERSVEPVTNPADRAETVGSVAWADAEDATTAVAAAAASGWGARPLAERAALLEGWADRLEGGRDALFDLLTREAGKTLPNAIAEWREAIDFCRYYAAEARRELPGTAPLGPMVCISPWNFPLAIFVGQIAAALVAGNPVLAKPAEQTPLVAWTAVGLAYDAGIPADALQCLPGPGETVGAALVRHPAIRGVIFTGSTEVARRINATLARRDDDPVLIAETGGVNAMIVDSSALPEEVVASTLSSAFDSAGQRCSALRLLCLQEDIADRVLTMLKGAMAELTIGDPARLDTDVGPVIDAEARDRIAGHVARLQGKGHPVHRLPLPAGTARGSFAAPCLIELAAPEQLREEVFGPVLHVVRFRAGEIGQTVAAINRAGYGLTHGIQTRIDETVDEVLGAVHAGNVYVNRNIVGAVVGVQPFGGERASGTGPKAGGPFYLHRLVRGGQPQSLVQALDGVGRQPRLAALSRAAEAAAQHTAIDRTALAAAVAALAPAVGAPRQIVLNGPTGERNLLELRPRGAVACVAAEPTALLAQALTVLATGNEPILPAEDIAIRLRQALPDAAIRLADDPALADAEAILADLAPDDLADLRCSVAERPGAIVPVIVPVAPLTYPAWRLYAERSISINTTASGGNAALLALDDRIERDDRFEEQT